MMHQSTLLAWCALALLASISPGPDTLLVVSHATRNLRAGLATAAGIVVGGFWYMALFGLGLMRLLQASPILFAIVKTVGALYLAYLGMRLLIGSWRGRKFDQPSAVRLTEPFRQGLLTNGLNPKVALFYLAALPQFAGNGSNAQLLGISLIAIHYLIGGLWMTIVAISAARAGNLMRGSNLVRWVEGALGALFVGLAGRLALVRNS